MSNRLLRLYMCACCRQKWKVLNKECRAAIEVAERYADDLATQSELFDAMWAADRTVTLETIYEDLVVFATLEDAALDDYVHNFHKEIRLSSLIKKDLTQCEVKYSVSNRKLIGELAWDAYTNRVNGYGYLDRTRLAVLCDALEEFGTDCEPLINHLRHNILHFRGCWVIDELIKSYQEKHLTYGFPPL